MKKLAIGCGIALLVGIVVVAAGGVLLWNRYVRPMAGAITEFAQVAEIEKQVRNTSSFTAPATGELTEEMVGRFVKVQQAMEARLGPRMEQLKSKYEEFDKAMKGEHRQASFREVTTALKDLSSLVVDAKRVQVEALNQGAFSVKEYEWVRRQVYGAIGMAAGSFDLESLKELAEKGSSDAPKAAEEVPDDVPERNKQLVAPHREKLRDWAALAYFGL